MGYYMAGDYYAAGGALDTVKGWFTRGGGGSALATRGAGAAAGGAGLGALAEWAATNPVGSVGAFGPGGAVQRAVRGALDLGGGGGRTYRRMNPLNPRALRRAMRRVESFAKFSKKTISFTKRVKMKKRRR